MNYKRKHGLIIISIIFSILLNLNYQVYEASEANITSVDDGNEIVNNTIRGRVDLYKESEDGNSLPGAEFTIYDDSGDVVDVLTTNKYGYTRSYLLDYGAYSVIETKAPIGYQLQSDIYNFNIINDGETVHLNNGNAIINEKVTNGESSEGGKLYIVSQRGVGSKYEIYDEDGNLVDTIIIDENGRGSSINLPYGNYCVQGGSSDFCFELSSSNEYQIYVDGTTEDNKAVIDNDGNDKEPPSCESNSGTCQLDQVNSSSSEVASKSISATGSSSKIIIYILLALMSAITLKYIIKRN